jgi:hypothetical protein
MRSFQEKRALPFSAGPLLQAKAFSSHLSGLAAARMNLAKYNGFPRECQCDFRIFFVFLRIS